MKRPPAIKGIFEDRFWEFIKNGECKLQKCTACGEFRYPPAPVCSQCLSENYEWENLKGTGTVYSWVTFHKQYFEELKVPYNVVSVMMDEGILLIGNLLGTQEIQVNMPVRLVFEELENSGKIFQFVK
jgi:uncharacterized OB-fold protein